MDADYLEKLCQYTGWKIEYVECASWNDALDKLKKREVDLVGSAQYSEERKKVYDFASLSSGYTFGCLFVEKGSDLAFEDFEHMKNMTFGVVESYIRKKDIAFWDKTGSKIQNSGNTIRPGICRLHFSAGRLMWLPIR